MDTIQAYKLAREIMNKWGLEDWQLEFDRSVRRFGACHYSKKKITLSRALVSCNEIEQVEEVSKHEVSHALAWNRFGREGRGHGWRWKQVCLEVGAKPERCYSESEVNNTAKPKYYLRHKETGKVYKKYFRRPKFYGRVSEIWMTSDPSTNGKLELVTSINSEPSPQNRGIREFQFDD